MNNQTPFIAAITILGVILLLSFVNSFFRKYKIVKKKKQKKRRVSIKSNKERSLSQKQVCDYERGLAAFDKWYKQKNINK